MAHGGRQAKPRKMDAVQCLKRLAKLRKEGKADRADNKRQHDGERKATDGWNEKGHELS